MRKTDTNEQLMDRLIMAKRENLEHELFVTKLTVILIITTIIAGVTEIADGIFFTGKFFLDISIADKTDIISGIMLIIGAIFMFITHIVKYKYEQFGRFSIIFISSIWGGLGIWYSYYMIAYKMMTIIWILCLFTSFVCILIAKRGNY